MKKKILTLIFAVCLMLPCAFALNACQEDDKIIYVDSCEDLIEAFEDVEKGGTIILEKDIVIDEVLIANKEFTLDMNGKKISNTQDIWIDTEEIDNWSLISVQKNGNLTIKGNGQFLAKENDCYAVDVRDGGKCKIENGKFLGNISAVYVVKGELIIKGGEFDIQQLDPSYGRIYTINCYDANHRNDTANISISGGKFYDYNPQGSQGEYPVANFLKEGYTIEETSLNQRTIYTVVAE